MDYNLTTEYKKKMLEYLEKECDQQRSTNEEIANRAGIAATLLVGISFLTIDNTEVPDTVVFECGGIAISILMLMGFLFIVSFALLVFLLTYKRNIWRLNYALEFRDVYGTPEQQPDGDFYRYYSLRLLGVWRKNQKIISCKVRVYNAALMIQLISAVIYICCTYIR